MASPLLRTLQIKRGTLAAIPALLDGELYFVETGSGAGSVYIGTTGGNVLLFPLAAPTVEEYRASLTATGTIGAPASTAIQRVFLPVDATAGSIVATLPAASAVFSATHPCTYVLKRVDAIGGNTITVVPAGSDTIDYSAPSIGLATQNAVLRLHPVSASAWWTV